MDPFGYSPEQYAAAAAWVGAVAAVVSVVVLIGTGYFILGQLREAQRLREDQSRPYVVVRWDIDGQVIYLVIENLGQSTATDVHITFEDRLVSKAFQEIDFAELAALKNGIPTLVPRQQLRFHFDMSVTRLDAELPLTYAGEVAYLGAQRRRYGPERFVLDLSAYRGTALSPKGLPELVSAVQAILKQLQKHR